MTSPPAASPKSRAIRAKDFPGWPARIIIAVCLLAVLVVRALGQLADPPRPLNDPALRNLLTLVLSFIAALTLWIWACFQSPWRKSLQRGLLVTSLALTVLFFSAFRFVEVSGNMIPRFEPRWSEIHDRALAKIDAPATQSKIDLRITTPDDFPQFLGPDRSAWLPTRGLARDWSVNAPKLLWKRPVGAGWSAFAAVNGYAVTLEQRGQHEWVACYEIATGEPAWGHAIEARHEHPLGGIGPRSTPTIHEGRVFALGATGVLRCLDGASGQLLWQEDLRARYGVSQSEDEALVQWGRASSPLIVDQLVIVPGGGKSGEAKNLAAFEVATGKLVWQSAVQKAADESDQISYASPRLATVGGIRQVLITNEGTASGHAPATGKTLWSYIWSGKSNADANSSQVVPIGESQVMLSKGYGGGAELLELGSQDESGKLGVKSVWKNTRVLQTKFTNVVVYQSHAYALSEGILECVELATGKRKWKQGRYGHGQILGVGELLLVLAEDGRVALVEASPAGFSELGSFQAIDGKTWNNLCLAGHHILVRNGEEAACYELP